MKEKEIKSAILAGIEFLPNKVNFDQCTPQVIYLESNYTDELEEIAYTLKVEVLVEMYDKKGKNEIYDYNVESFTLITADGKDPKVRFRKHEIVDYIDF